MEINTNRLHSEFKIEARYGKPRVAFRETIPAACSITGVFDRIIGDNQFYAEVDIELNPEHVEQGIAVMSAIHGKEIPGSWIKTARETLNGALKTGGNLGYPLIYIKGTVKAIRGLPDKTTDGSVAGAVMNAVQQAVAQGTTLLEPLMRLDITAPEDVIGEINGYLQSKRAVIHGMDNVAGAKVLHCEVPLAEMFGFSSALPKLSGGRASFTMEPHGYQEISRENLLRMGGEDYSVGF